MCINCDQGVVVVFFFFTAYGQRKQCGIFLGSPEMLSPDYFNSVKHCFRYLCVVLLLELFQMSHSLPYPESVKCSMYCGKFYHVPYRICYEVNISAFNGSVFVSFIF